jgi:5-methylthioribose kinase
MKPLTTPSDVFSFYRSKAELQSQFPDLTEVTALEGGLANFIYRMRYKGGTAVLKCFPPYIRQLPALAFDRKRYFVEKTALEVLGKQTWSQHVRVPSLLYACDEAYLLVMEDAGENHKTLLEYMEKSNQPDKEGDDALMKCFSREVSAFVRGMKDLNLTQEQRKVFRNPAAWSVLKRYSGRAYTDCANRYEVSGEMQPFMQHIPPMVETEEGWLCHGDLWPNSFVVDESRAVFWLLDWEMARYRDAPTADLEQFNSNLWVMSQSSKFDRERVHALVKGLEQEYFDGGDWRVCRGDVSRANFVLWVLTLVQYAHFGLDDELMRKAVLDAAAQVHVTKVD